MRKNIVFVSHCSADSDFTARIFPHLENLEKLADVRVWTDKGDIRAGDIWNDEINEALEGACLAVLLVSPAFFNSVFISGSEVPALKKRRTSGLRIIPLHMKPGAWPDWIKHTEMRPKGEKSLYEIFKADEALFERHMAQVIEEIRHLLASDDAEPNPAAVKLLCATLLADMPEPEDFAGSLVRDIRRLTGLDGDGLFNATRLFVEYHLLESKDPGNHATLELSPVRDARPPEDLVDLLRQFGGTADPQGVSHTVMSEFFDRSLERESEWKRYFDAVAQTGMAPESIASVLRIRAGTGYIAAQSLVAGLLAKFGNEWRPVLNAYLRAVPDPKQRYSGFESLQASQWNCWLMWGPSIPICTCDQWRGVFAFQYGYGDENNSLPLLEIPAEGQELPKRLNELGGQLRAERRGAKFSELAARLRWAPWFLKEYSAVPAEPQFDPALRDRRRQKRVLTKYPAAVAQVNLYKEGNGSGLALQLDNAGELQPERETRIYFSAYYWLIFLVATPPAPGERGKEGPRLLRGRHYPDWETRATGIVSERLWQNLLPVFVHANIGDPEAFTFQRQVLVENALQLLRGVWGRRGQLFHADDVTAGIRFYLACASDYSGCGCPIRYAPQTSLVDALRERLRTETDGEFAQAVELPPADETADSRPPGMAGYFSACHMPELIAGYYEHVDKIARSD